MRQADALQNTEEAGRAQTHNSRNNKESNEESTCFSSTTDCHNQKWRTHNRILLRL